MGFLATKDIVVWEISMWRTKHWNYQLEQNEWKKCSNRLSSMWRKKLIVWSAKPLLCNFIILHCNEGLTTCMKDIDEWKEKSSYGRRSRSIPTRRVDRQNIRAFVEDRVSKGNISKTWRLVVIEVFFRFGQPFFGSGLPFCSRFFFGFGLPFFELGCLFVLGFFLDGICFFSSSCFDFSLFFRGFAFF
jgi:hypothetical protein